MQVFTAIDGKMALVLYLKGVLRQVQMYRRGDLVYLPHAGGYIQVRNQQPEGYFTTSHPDIKLLEYDVDEHITVEGPGSYKPMRWTAS
jgi:hypothetical protein